MATTLKVMSNKIWRLLPNVGAKELYDEINNSIGTLNSEGFIQEAIEDCECLSTANGTYTSCCVADLDTITNQVTSVLEIRDVDGFRLSPRSLEYMEKYQASSDRAYCQIGNKVIVSASKNASGGNVEIICYESLPQYTTFNSASSITVNDYFLPAIVYLTIANLCQKDAYADGNKTVLYMKMYMNEVAKLQRLVLTFKEQGYQQIKVPTR